MSLADLSAKNIEQRVSRVFSFVKLAQRITSVDEFGGNAIHVPFHRIQKRFRFEVNCESLTIFEFLRKLGSGKRRCLFHDYVFLLSIEEYNFFNRC